jgi:phosphoribosylaminoimidazole-succinocarboxamide synthase
MVLMTTSDLPLRRIARGKVRDVYEVEATDSAGRHRPVSAFDVVMAGRSR